MARIERSSEHLSKVASREPVELTRSVGDGKEVVVGVVGQATRTGTFWTTTVLG